jgi:hypothetical protein
MAKKKTEEKPIVTVSTTTDVAEKPRKTRKKVSSNLRSTDAVISEITEKKGTVADTSKAVAMILTKSGSTKKESAIKRINDNGEVNMTGITEAELAEMVGVDKIYKTTLISEGRVICFIPSEYWVKIKNTLNLAYPQYEMNAQNLQYEINLGGKIHGLLSAAVLYNNYE